MGNGFDTSRNPRDITTWNRLGRAQHDDIQREFDPASQRHTLRHRFRVPQYYSVPGHKKLQNDS